MIKATDPMQDPKYDFIDHRVLNRATGEYIPDDEPVFVFRARDIRAHRALQRYFFDLPEGTEHEERVLQRCADFREFALNHPERMKEPGTR